MSIDPAKLTIITYPKPILRRSTAPLDAPADDIRAVGGRMIELMHEADGVGLAAPQVGLDWRLFVTRAFGEDDVDRIYVNPTLQLSGELISQEEGCLSLPGIHVQIRRPQKTIITAIDPGGVEFTMRSDGFPARVWQHEFDHLNGVLIIDRLSPLDRLAVRKPLKELETAGQGL